MRYNVGETTYFIYIDFEPSKPRFGNMYFPWEDKLNSLTVLPFVCKEHHRVAGDWDDEVKYDGYIFSDTEGNDWTNQYPRASYGQLSDDNNWRLWPTERSDIKDKPFLHYTDISIFLENVLRGIKELKKRSTDVNEKDDPKWLINAAESLQKLFDDINNILKEKYGVKAVNVGHQFYFTDGRAAEHHRDIPDVKIVPKDQDIEHICY